MVATMNQVEAVNAAAEETKKQLDKLLAERADLDEEINHLGRELAGLRGYVERRQEPVKSGTGRPQIPWADLKRTDAIVEALRILDAPSSPKDVTRFLQSQDREDKYQLVSAALAYLKNKGVVISEGRGAWVLNHDRPDFLIRDAEGRTRVAEIKVSNDHWSTS